ncbi:MAG: hypothetical protein ACRDI2_15940 [Chloroflexota bacterium]
MALRLDETLREQRERIQPYVEELQALVRRYDPDARFALNVGHDTGFWELDAYVRSEVDEDEDFARVLAEKATDIHLEHDAAIVVVTLPRHD